MAILKLSQSRDPDIRIRQLVDNLNLLADPCPEIDVSSISYITPLTIVPLAMRISNYEVQPKIITAAKRSLDNLTMIQFPYGHSYSPQQQSSALNHRPIYKVIVDGSDRSNPILNLNSLAQTISDLAMNYLTERNEDAENYRSAVSYALSELCDNVHEHAEARSCWIYFRFWKPRGEFEFCISDDGIGIKHRYDRSGFGTQNHLDAIDQAVRGKSTKTDLRGYGIGSTISMFTSHKLRGEACLISGNACYLKTHTTEARIGRIPTYWKGTIFSVRLTRPTSRINVVEYAST